MRTFPFKNIEFQDREVAIASINDAPPSTAIIVDLDETLLLRNSTAEYLNSLQPRLLGLLILKFLGLIKPWNWLPKPLKGLANRDWFLVVISTCLFPWTIFLWQNKAKQLAETHVNQELLEVLKQKENNTIIIATLGFNFIVNPIIESFSLKYALIVSCRFWQGFKDRTKGKLQMIREVLSDQEIVSATAITDSQDDLPLLEKVAQPCLVTWSLAKYISPMSNIYLPFVYLEKVKRPGSNYFVRLICLDDFPLLLLAFVWGANHLIEESLGLFLLLMSFWCIYEFGYYENDLVGEKYEEKPVLSHSYFSYKERMKPWQPWIWALSFGVLGIIWLDIATNLLNSPGQILPTIDDRLLKSSLLLALYWTGFLIVSRFCFWVYNYCNKQTRIWLYIVIQAVRYYGFAVIFPINLIASSLLSSQILGRTMLYISYRYSGGDAKNWPYQIPEKMLRLSIFICLLVSLSLGSQNFLVWQSWQTWTILLYLTLQGINQIGQAVSKFKLVTQDGSN
jgi:hypothetical protein